MKTGQHPIVADVFGVPKSTHIQAITITLLTSPPMNDKYGFTKQQWILLAFSFILGIVSVFTVDKVFLSGAAAQRSVQAAVSHP